MGLLSPELEYVLPRLGSQAAELDPMVFAHFTVPDFPWSYYVTEGQRWGSDYLFFGFLMASEDEMHWGFTRERLSRLERMLTGRVVRDHQFTPGLLTDVVVLIDEDPLG